MKRIKNILLVAGVALFSLQSCDLERFPLTDMDESNFWKDENNAQLALTSLYRGNITNGLEFNVSDFWSYHGLLFMENLSDNAWDRRGENNPFFGISSGKLTNDNGFIKNYWAFAYKRIELCNRFLAGLETLPDTNLKQRMKAEARFLRAAHYQYLASYFKDIPLVTVLLSGEEANNVKKESQTTVLDFCAKELKESADALPSFADISGNETGRACKQAALAFLGRVYMLQNKWKEAAGVYKQIIDYKENDIHPSYMELFLAGSGVGNKENIFYITYLENFFGAGFPQQILSAKDGGWSLSNPTAGLFESYEFKDGTPFSYDDPRYNPNNLGENRDPRLDYTIYYNGVTFKGSPYRLSPDYEAAAKERLDYSSEVSKTGFMWKKYFNESPISNLVSYSAVTPIIRYAEVLLGYLECLIESNESINQGVLDATINKIRGRQDVMMPPITETNPDKLRKILRNERRIELAFEGIRYWDLMRWHIAHKVLKGDVWGAPYPSSKLYETATKVIDPTGACRWYVGSRDFRESKDYQWPIPLSEQNINPNLRE